jgi:hypothetical protein
MSISSKLLTCTVFFDRELLHEFILPDKCSNKSIFDKTDTKKKINIIIETEQEIKLETKKEIKYVSEIIPPLISIKSLSFILHHSYGGFGDHLNILTSALLYAKQKHMPLIIDWRYSLYHNLIGNHESNLFNYVFKNKDELYGVKIITNPSDFPDNISKQSYVCDTTKYTNEIYEYYNDDSFKIIDRQHTMKEVISNDRKKVIKLLEFNDFIIDKVNKYKTTFDYTTVGIYYREGNGEFDNGHKTNINTFTQLLKDKITCKNNIFVCTDNKLILNKIKNTFYNNHIFQYLKDMPNNGTFPWHLQKIYDNNHGKNIFISTIVEMILLSEINTLYIGSRNTEWYPGFTFYARCINKNKIEIFDNDALIKN